MRISRSFSTFFWQSRQALYEPYTAPLNEEQKKALRKLMARELPQCNGHLNKDIQRLLQAYQSPQSNCTRRKQTIERVEHIIKTAYGPEYSVIDRSLYTYARDIDIAPLELAVHDGFRPKGFPPGTEDQLLPDPYNHVALAKLFQEHGYTGSFVAGDAERTLPPDALQLTRLQPVEERGDLPVNPLWPSFTPRPVPHLTYPPVLYAEHLSNTTMPFFLSPPMPTHVPLVRLLHTYCSSNGSFSDFVSLILLWVRSIDLPQLTPTCVALMVIGYLQVRKSVPSLQNPKGPKEIQRLAEMDEGVWVRAEWPPRYPPKAFWVETAFMSSPVSEALSTSDVSPAAEIATTFAGLSRQKKLGPLLVDFFQFWSQQNTATFFISSEHALSAREGAVIPRVSASKSVKAVLRRDEANERLINQGSVPWSPKSEPIMWQTQRIAIPDPFIPSYNHAQSLSKSAGAYFHYFSSLSYRTLFRGHPLASVMGSHLPLPKGVIRNNPTCSRAYSTGILERQARELYESMLPPSHIFAARAQTISRVQKAIKDKFGAAYFVESFGSTQYGVSSATSDLDLVIMDPRCETGFSPKFRVSGLPDVYDVKRVARTLSKKGFNRVVAIPKATVPIVKFRDPATGLECDLNTNDQLGLWNTRLISKYCDLSSDLVRPMIMIIKRWAKSHGLNDPSGQYGLVTFSSYALALMVIGFLQVKGALPNLQAGLEPLPKVANEGVFWIQRKKRDPVRCDIRFSGEKDWQPETQMELGEALESWFMFWANEYDYSNQLLNIRAGGLSKRVRPPPKGKKTNQNKVRKIEAISLLESQQSVRELEEELTLAAWRSQNASNEEDIELQHVGTPVEEASEIVAESRDACEDEVVKLEDSEELEAAEVVIESQSTDPAFRSQGREEDIDDRPKEPHEYSELWVESACLPAEASDTRIQINSRLQESPQPTQWGFQTLVVADPFILDKNVCGNINRGTMERFKAECQRSILTLTCGGDLADLMGDECSLPGAAVQRRGNGRGIARNSNRGGKGGKANDRPGAEVAETMPKPDGEREGGASPTQPCQPETVGSGGKTFHEPSTMPPTRIPNPKTMESHAL